MKERFGGELAVFLDRAEYFCSRDLWEYVSGERVTETVADRSPAFVGKIIGLVLPVETARAKRSRRLLGSAERVVQTTVDP